MQRVLNDYHELTEFFADSGSRNIMLVHGKSLERFESLGKYLDTLKSLGLRIIHFTDFKSNPILNDAEHAANFFAGNQCDSILAVGGGSAMDTAKYVRLKNHVPFAVIPTTAGSGSEATRFAVLYQDGKKLSLTDDIMIPDAVLLDDSLLVNLPEYHRKSSALDAFSHALESFWSVNATEQSRNFSREALTDITRLLENYPDSYDAKQMLRSSYTAGKAINLAQTTAGHAMCYKITGIFHTAHGHSAALCNRVLFRYLAANTKLPVLNDIADSMKCKSPELAAEEFNEIFTHLGLDIPEAGEQELAILANSVNPERLKNFPVQLDPDTIKNLYREILKVRS